MKKTVIAVLAAVSLVSPAMANNVPLSVLYQEAEKLAAAQNAREEVLYNACKNDYFDIEKIHTSYPKVYIDAVCTCFTEKIINFEYNGPEQEVREYFYSNNKYRQIQNKEAVNCIKTNEQLKWY